MASPPPPRPKATHCQLHADTLTPLNLSSPESCSRELPPGPERELLLPEEDGEQRGRQEVHPLPVPNPGVGTRAARKVAKW